MRFSTEREYACKPILNRRLQTSSGSLEYRPVVVWISNPI